jgi:hypothetical protein
MARTPKNLNIGAVSTTDLTTLYTAPSGINTTISVLSFTNTTSTSIVIDIYRNDGSTDYLVKTMTLPGGSGQERVYYELSRRVINAAGSIKVQADSSSTFNYELSGSEVEV